MEDGEGDFEELVEDRDEHGHFGFAVEGEAIGEGFEARIAASGDHGGHEEDAAEVTVTLRAWSGGAVERGAGLADPRSDGEPGRGGTGIGEVSGQFGAEPAGGTRTDAFDGAESLEIGL